MRFNFRKISAIATSALMIGMSAGVAAAANYPAPFIEAGSANVAVVMSTGQGYSALDHIEATNIFSDLQSRSTGTEGTDGSVTGESAPLWSGSDRIYFGDQLADGGVTQVTKTDLPTILADGTFDNGEDNDYSQIIEFGATTFATFTFDTSGSDLTDPELIIDLGTATGTPVYDLVVDFDTATVMNTTDAEGEQITLFGKQYTLSTETDDDELYLFGSSETVSLSVGGADPSSTEVTVDGKTYTVELKGATASTADVKVTKADGTSDTKTVSEGDSAKINGLEVGVNIASSSEATSSESAELMVGANKIRLKDGDKVKVGSALDSIDGTLVDLTPNAANGALTQIKIRVSAADNDLDHLAVGDSFMDPVFGAVKLSFVGVDNAPDLSAGEKDMNTERSKVEVIRDGNSALGLKLTDKNGKTATIPFMDDSTPASDGTNLVLADEDGNVISTVEGEDIGTEDSYVMLNSNGEYVGMGQVTSFDNTDCTETDFTLEDVMSGETIVDWDAQAVDTTKTFTYKGKTFTATCADGAAFSVADATTGSKNVFPFFELYSGYDHRAAFIEPVIAMDNATTASNTTLVLPTGSVDVIFADTAVNDCTVTISGTGVTTTAIAALNVTAVDDSVQVGTVFYNFNVQETGTDDAACTAVDLTVGIDAAVVSGSDVADVEAGFLIVEEDDATNSDVNEAVYIPTDDDGGTNLYAQIETPIFTDAEVSDPFDADGLTGYFDAFGTYVLLNTDGDQDILELSLPKTQMYAELYIAEDTATVTTGSSGGGAATFNGVVVADTEVASVSGKNLIIVGGSCVNTAAATLVGGAHCGSDWTQATGVGTGQYLIKGYATNSLTNKLALLVAGYEKEDTVNAAKFLRTQTVDTSKKYVGTTATAAEMMVEETTA